MSKFIISYDEYGSSEPTKFKIFETQDLKSLSKEINEYFGLDVIDAYAIKVYLVACEYKTELLKELVIVEKT